MPLIGFLLILFNFSYPEQMTGETHLAGVFQGRSLFIQNPYNAKTKGFCISEVYVNDRAVKTNYRMSAIQLQFEGIDNFSPVSIKIVHLADCKPIIINPDAIFFHSVFAFEEIAISDSSLSWQTRGELAKSIFIIQRYQQGIWIDQDSVLSMDNFGGAHYKYFPKLEEGPNKLRIQYVQPDGKYLFSREIDFHYYPEPVTFTPPATASDLQLSRVAKYDIYDGGGTLVLTGFGKEIDVSELPRGDYVIYFNDKEPGVFKKK